MPRATTGGSTCRGVVTPPGSSGRPSSPPPVTWAAWMSRTSVRHGPTHRTPRAARCHGRRARFRSGHVGRRGPPYGRSARRRRRSPAAVPDAGIYVAIAVTVCEFTADPCARRLRTGAHHTAGVCVVVGALNLRSPWGIANRAQFTRPPWAGATFLSAGELRRLGDAHGSVTIRPALYPPRALPAVEWWGVAVERTGRAVAPRWGAFNVMSINIPVDRRSGAIGAASPDRDQRPPAGCDPSAPRLG